MKVVITGGTGLIGKALAHSLVADRHEVVVLTRNPNKQVPGLPSSVRLVKWDAKTGEGWRDELEGAEAIVNLAGESLSPQSGRWSEARKKSIKQSRIEATKAVVDGIRGVTNKPKVLIQSSAVGYYGTHNDEIINERRLPGGDFLAEVTQAWEESSRPVDKMGVRRVIIRTGVVFDDEGGSLPLLVLPFKLFVGGPVGSGNQYISWIHIDDEVGAIRFLMANEKAHGAFNLTAPHPVTNREFGNVAGRVLGRPSFFPTPGFIMKLVLGEASTLALDGQRVVPVALQRAGYDFKFPELEGALRDLLT